MKQRLVVFIIVLVATVTASAQISAQFFGLHATTTNPWPTAENIQFSTWRSQDALVKWSDINTSNGVYDFSHLDHFLQFTAKNGQTVLYNFYYTPSWASSNPYGSCRINNLGGCYPPNDLNADGSGTDQHVKDFITALMQHVGAGKIQYLEIWNEPNIAVEWTGTTAQIVRITQDVRQIAKSYDPNIKIVSPAETGDGKMTQSAPKMVWLGDFFAAGGGQYVDTIAMHGYEYYPEAIIQRINSALAQMSQYGQSSKPLFVTEGSWYPPSQFPTNQQTGFSFRQYLSILSTPVQRFFLYEYNDPNEGNLWDAPNSALAPPGVAYQLFYNWLVGATMTQPCQAQSNNSSIWSCTFTRSGGYQAEAIWSASLAWGQKTTVTVPSQYVQYRDLYKNVYPINNHQVQIGYDPIWLEN